MWPFKKKRTNFPDISKEFSIKRKMPDLDIPIYKKEPVLGVSNRHIVDIPKREKAPVMPKKFDYLKKDVLLPKIEHPPIKTYEKPKIESAEMKDGHMFVEIENYKVVLAKMDMIKNKIKDTEKIMDELNKIRVREEKELGKWYKDIEGIKEKLIEIDNKLFKV